MQDQETNLTQSPAVYGYAWVEHSNEASQMLDIQIQTLRKNNVKGELIFTDIVGSPFFEVRPGWQSLSKKLNPGDTVYITQGPWQGDFHLHIFLPKFRLVSENHTVLAGRQSCDPETNQGQRKTFHKGGRTPTRLGRT